MTTINGTSGNDSLAGSEGDDTISGFAGDDTLYGGKSGNDFLVGGPGNDSLNGGGGTSTAIYSGTMSEYDIHWNLHYFTVTDHVAGRDGTDIAYVHNLEFSDTTVAWIQYQGYNVTGAAGDDSLTGTNKAEYIQAGAGNNTISGLGGDDYITAGDGNDTIDGGDGNDEIHVGAGNNRISGGAGDDTLYGGGYDNFNGGPGTDSVYFWAFKGALTANLVDGTWSDGTSHGTLISVEILSTGDGPDMVTGNGAANRLLGNAGDDMLYGGAGSDALLGGTGNDTLDGGTGSDSLVGGDGVDTASYLTQPAGVTASLRMGNSAETLGGDSLSGIENLLGTAYADRLEGDAGANRLDGDTGDDTLTGGGGDDTLVGGGGIDTAVYAGAHSGFSVHGDGIGGASISSVGGAEGIDTLQGVERLQFADGNVAIDLGGNAGVVARILGAVFGPASLQDTHLVGAGLRFVDLGLNLEEAVLLALDTRLGLNADPKSVVDLLWSNLFGSVPDPGIEASFIAMLNDGRYSETSLGVLAAQYPLNDANVHLVELTLTGLAY